MRVFLTILFLIFSIQLCAKADNIREFQIEGISIGDSLLKYFSLDEIKRNTWDYYNNKKYTPLQFEKPSFAKMYDALDIAYKTNDKEYKIEKLTGVILYKDKKKIKQCYKKMDSILADIRNNFSNLDESKKYNSVHTGIDDGGKSRVTSVYFYFKNNDMIAIQCYDYSEQAGDVNHLAVSLNSSDFAIWLSTEAYN